MIYKVHQVNHQFLTLLSHVFPLNKYKFIRAILFILFIQCFRVSSQT